MKLSPLLYPFNGVNPHSIIIADNASVHHVEGVTELLENLGVQIYFLPPYTPDFNPIEELFPKVKLTLRANEHLQEDLESLLLTSFLSIPPENWISHAGYH